MRSLRVLAVVVLLVVGIGAVLVATGVLPPTAPPRPASTSPATAARRDVTESVVASGTVSAATTYDLRFGEASQPAGSSSSSSNSNANASTPTWPVTSVAVKVGDAVNAGDVLAVADPTNARLQLEIAKANLAAAKSKLTADKSAPTAATKAAASDALRQAQLQLSQAQSNYSHTVSPERDLPVAGPQRPVARQVDAGEGQGGPCPVPDDLRRQGGRQPGPGQPHDDDGARLGIERPGRQPGLVGPARARRPRGTTTPNRLAKSTPAQLASDEASVATRPVGRRLGPAGRRQRIAQGADRRARLGRQHRRRDDRTERRRHRDPVERHDGDRGVRRERRPRPQGRPGHRSHDQGGRHGPGGRDRELDRGDLGVRFERRRLVRRHGRADEPADGPAHRA